MNVREAAMQVLREAGKPLLAKEISERIIAGGFWSSDGKTPDVTVSARLYSDIRKNGDKSLFARVAPQTFALRDIQIVSETRISEPPPGKDSLSFLNAAEQVLSQFANGQAMHYREITERALEQGWLLTTGKTPEATMNAQLVTDLKRHKAGGGPGRFRRFSPGYYGLTAWAGTGLPFQISEHNRKIRKQLIKKLKELTASQFEELVGQLLAEMGFESVEVTKQSNDGGIDVRGTLQISDVIRIKMAVQAKKWKNNIQAPVVQQVRGSLGVHEQGLIITTSNFSKGAITEASQPDKTPVALMNGEQFVSLLIEYGIGVRRMSHDLFELKGELLDR